MKANNETNGKPVAWVIVINTPDFVVEENMETGERRIVKK